MGIKGWFMLPEAAALASLDDQAAVAVHAEIIRRKPFLKRLYRDVYLGFRRDLPDAADARVVELGSGGGFIKEVIPRAITSDIRRIPGVDMRFSALEMPFAAGTLDALLLFDVFHHLPDAERFLREADRCLKTGGRLLMTEPANTLWGRFIWQNFHHEPFRPASGWRFAAAGPMSSANGALAWIIFCRDRERFQARFPALKIRRLRPYMPLRYIISGGVSLRQLLPGGAYPLVSCAERLLSPLDGVLGMFYDIVIEKS
ncbi:MAG: class I SAM-dependent methyltransferase [Elusimicrobia bacterium]|nr:class I SAM-dependent methyltransferase [Elusimicrobiota bacterium]